MTECHGGFDGMDIKNTMMVGSIRLGLDQEGT